MPLPSITPAQWEQAGQLFDRLSNTPPEQRRLDLLDCDAAVVEVVSEMLATNDSEDPFVLDRTMHRLSAALLGSGNHPPVEKDYRNHRFGPWRAVEEIGRGGMGIVLRGERADGEFDKTVAIKLLPGTGARLAESRLTEEIRILARLEHPGIARLIDGGVDDQGTRFLVMEYVDGRPITEHCRELGLEARLALFDQVLKAVDHAHRHLVVHCDLKPANILVTDEGQVRLVDFGIAGMLGDAAGARGEHRGWFCSPGYASPEQLAGHAPSVSQDVFSLGAVLYETLTGIRLRNNRDATKLLLKPHGQVQTVSPPSNLDRSLDRDLDAICLKALMVEPDERYESVGELRRDLQLRKKRLPVVARNGGRSYRAWRFVSRHRWALTASAAVLAVSIAGVLATLWQAGEARAQAEQALSESQRERATREFLVQLFYANGPDIARGRVLTARDLLDLGVQQIAHTYAHAPDLRAEMLTLLGDLHRQIGENEKAEELLAEGLQMARQHGPSDLLVNALHRSGQFDLHQGRHDKALSALEEAERLLDELGQIPGQKHAALMQQLAFTLGSMGRRAEAIDRAESALEIARTEPDLPTEALFDYLWSLGNALLGAQQIDRAESLLIEAIALEFETASAPSRQRAVYANLGSVLEVRGDLEGALDHKKRAMELAEQIYPPGHLRRAQALNNLAVTYGKLGRLDDAAQALIQALEILETIDPDGRHPTIAASYNNLAQNRAGAARHAEAATYQQRARELARELFGIDDVRFATATANLGEIFTDLERYSEAEDLLEEAMAIRMAVLGDDHNLIGATKALLARLYLAQGRPVEALDLTTRALALYERIGWQSPSSLAYALTHHARALADLGRIRDARAAFSQGLALREAAGATAGREYIRLLADYAEFLAAHDPITAREAATHAATATEESFGADHPDTQRLQALVASLDQTTH